MLIFIIISLGINIGQLIIINVMKDEILLKLGQKIRYERVKRKLSQESLAELAGLCTQSISTLEAGINNVRFITFYKIVKVLDLDLGDFSDFKL